MEEEHNGGKKKNPENRRIEYKTGWEGLGPRSGGHINVQEELKRRTHLHPVDSNQQRAANCEAEEGRGHQQSILPPFLRSAPLGFFGDFRGKRSQFWLPRPESITLCRLKYQCDVSAQRGMNRTLLNIVFVLPVNVISG